MIREWVAAVLIVVPVAGPSLAAPAEDAFAAQEKRLQELEAEIARVRQEIEQIRQQRQMAGPAEMAAPAQIAVAPAPTPAPAPMPAPTLPPAPTSPLAFSTLTGFTFTVGGRVKLDAIHDFDAIGSTFTFDPRTIPLDGREGTGSRFSIADSRLNLDINGPLMGRPLKLFFEGDLLPNGSNLRLRHAYASYGGLLVGQYWTNFMDEENIPYSLDAETATAYALARGGQIRWTAELAPLTAVSFAVEEPNPEIQVPSTIAGRQESPLPDFTMKLKYRGERGHIQGSAFLGQARFRPDIGEAEDIALWGVMVSGRIRTFGDDEVYAQLAYGPGIGRYRGGVTSALDPLGQLHNLTVGALMIGYHHYWSSHWSSNAVYAVAELVEDDVGDPSITQKRLEYGAINLRYWIVPRQIYVGGEYLWGFRQIVSGANGTADRVQFTVNFNFPS